MSFTHVETAARRKLGVGPEWIWIEVERIGQDILMTGAVPTARYKTGKRKGRPKWSKDAVRSKVVLHPEDIAAAEAEYEATAGLCSRCDGEGQLVASVDTRGGEVRRTYRNCPKCKGSGKANGKEVGA